MIVKVNDVLYRESVQRLMFADMKQQLLDQAQLLHAMRDSQDTVSAAPQFVLQSSHFSCSAYFGHSPRHNLIHTSHHTTKHQLHSGGECSRRHHW